MVTPSSPDSKLNPGVARASLQPEPVQRSRDLIIWVSASHLVDDLDRFHTCASVMLARWILLDAQFRMTAPRPVNHQQDLASLIVHVGDDLLDQNSYNALLQTHVRRFRVPDHGQILRQAA